jgi:phosphatidylserine/phosphatidylglycerophosphate/cardiolipin synthase-like enzyme
MAEFLTTQGTAYHLENIVTNAAKWLVLISPFLNITENLLSRLQEAEKRKVKICIVYGKDDLNPAEKVKLRKLESLTLRYYKNLHAKCYINEDSMIITSMNLHGFSEQTNREMGVLIRKNIAVDEKIYDDAIKEVKSIIDLSIEGYNSKETEDQSKVRPRAYQAAFKKDVRSQGGESFISYLKTILTKDVTSFFSKYGHCIRCNKQIPYDPNKPYCKECYFSLPEWVDTSNKEKFCHSCGKRDKSSMLYPLCRPCFQKSQK